MKENERKKIVDDVNAWSDAIVKRLEKDGLLPFKKIKEIR